MICILSTVSLDTRRVEETKLLFIQTSDYAAGPIVRVAPNEVSFNTAESWKDIYASRKTQKTFIKSGFYDGGSFAGRGVHSIVSERQPQVHAEMRHYLSSAFSDRALNEQEDLISQSIDKFVELLPKQPDDWDLTKGYEMLTFDIIGDLAFGESFGAIESRKSLRSCLWLWY